MIETSSVFSRTEAESSGEILSHTMYNLAIGLTLAWGFFVNWLMVKSIPAETLLRIHPLLFIVGYMACAFAGVALYTKSDNPLISFIGYNLVVLPFGLVVNIVVSRYNSAVVLDAIRITGIATLLMMVLGTMFPAFFQRIVGALTIALIAVLIVEFVEVFIFKVHHGILDWMVAVIMCGYIGYDWGRANRIPKTLDNAIDSAAALYMDIIILFLRILSILGRRR
jgi:FtsH-binding integral membrane protein